MLVLTRKEDQRLKIGDDVVVTIVRISKTQVRLGIEAPANVNVVRMELDPPCPAETRRDAASTLAAHSAA